MRLFINLLLFVSVPFLVSSCGTIVGGAKYTAHVVVPNNSKAKISYLGEFKGYGNADFMVKRKDANKLVIEVSEEGCPTEEFKFNKRIFRGSVFVGSLITFTSIPFIPYGNIIDFIVGANWKPNVVENGVSKETFNHFRYSLDYKTCANGESESFKHISGQKEYVDVLFLKDGSVIKGVITEVIPNERVKIKLADGSILTFNINLVARMNKEEIQK